MFSIFIMAFLLRDLAEYSRGKINLDPDQYILLDFKEESEKQTKQKSKNKKKKK